MSSSPRRTRPFDGGPLPARRVLTLGELQVEHLFVGLRDAFLLLHASVIGHYVVRQRSRDWPRHLVVPLLGILILGYVLIQAQVAAQVIGLAWLAFGVVIMVVLLVTGRQARLAQGSDEGERT